MWPRGTSKTCLFVKTERGEHSRWVGFMGAIAQNKNKKTLTNRVNALVLKFDNLAGDHSLDIIFLPGGLHSGLDNGVRGAGEASNWGSTDPELEFAVDFGGINH
jgi:hypothetical protein